MKIKPTDFVIQFVPWIVLKHATYSKKITSDPMYPIGYTSLHFFMYMNNVRNKKNWCEGSLTELK